MSSLGARIDAAAPELAQTAMPGASQRHWINARIDALLPTAGPHAPILTQALRGACVGRGKRVRPILAMLSAAHFGGIEMAALDFGCAIEMIHTASLILDDLPCMDDAAMRRGQPTLHRRFGEDAAVLASIALLSHAYGVIANDEGLGPAVQIALSRLIHEAVGVGGLVSGQIRDLRDPASMRDEAALTSLNHQKTGALFVAAMVGGAVIAGADQAACVAARDFAGKLGLAFQLLDDLQDATSTLEIMGKDACQDRERVTFVTLWGVERTQTAVTDTIEDALELLGDRRCALATYALDLFQPA